MSVILEHCKKMKSSIAKYNNKSFVLLFIISMTFAFTSRYGDLELGFQLQLIIAMLWIILGGCKFSINKFRFRGLFKEDYCRLLKLFLLPLIVIHLYSVFLMFIGKVDWKYLTSNLTVYVPTLLAITAIYLLGTKAYLYTCVALLLSWLISVGSSFVLKGPGIFVHAILQAYIDPFDQSYDFSANYLELHDLVLSVGYILVAFLFSNSKLTKKQFLILFMFFIILILGMKRITVLGIIFVISFYEFINRFSDKKKYKFCILFGTIGVITCYLYVYIFTEGSFFYDYISSHGINMMGRNYYYKEILNLASFSPTFIGIGRNAVTQILTTKLSYLHVGGVHSDVIKMYIESGFILFGIWLWYYLIYLLKIFKKYYGVNAAVLYFGVIIYKFTLYLTDNVEIYFISQILSIMIPVTYVLKLKKSYNVPIRQ